MEVETREISEQAFEAYGELIQNVSAFRYLGRVLTARDDYWLAAVGNRGKARKILGRLSRILSWEGSDPKLSRNFYKALDQELLPLGEETWVFTQRTEKAPDNFQSRVARRLTRKQP